MNEQQDYLSQNKGYNTQMNLPNSTASLVLGIISIVTSICYVSALIGIICGIIGLVLSNKDRDAFRNNPDVYSQASYGQANTGRTCSIIGIILASLWLLLIIIMLIFAGSLVGLKDLGR